MRAKSFLLAALFLTGTASMAAAQTMGAAHPISDATRQAWEGVRKNIKESADFMAEANYGFKPSADDVTRYQPRTPAESCAVHVTPALLEV